MEVFESFVLILFIFVLRVISQSDICTESGDRLQISEAFRINTDLFVKTKTPKNTVFRIKNLVFDGNQITFDSVTKDSLMTQLFGEVIWIFSYKMGNDTKVVGIFYQKSEGLHQPIGYVYQFNDDFTQYVSKYEFTVNLYKKDTDDSGLRLKTLFLRFPEKDVELQMTSITGFPQNTFDHLSKRLFVYYLENASQTGKSCTGKCYHFKRYVLKNTTLDYIPENEWTFDKTSDNKTICVELEPIVDASVVLTNYSTNGDFDLIEFSEDNYLIHRISVDPKTDVVQKWNPLTNGLIRSLFKCESMSATIPQISNKTTDSDKFVSTWSEGNDSIETKTDPIIKTTVTPIPKKSKEWVFWMVLIAIVVVALIAIISSIAYVLASDLSVEKTKSRKSGITLVKSSKMDSTGKDVRNKGIKNESNSSVLNTNTVRSKDHDGTTI